MHKKINIFAEKDALLKLSQNKEFTNGRNIKQILKNLSKIFLIMEEDEFDKEWNNVESDLRKFFDAFDIPKPEACSKLKSVYKDPVLCSKLDPFALWLFNKSDYDLDKFRNYLGVWALNADALTDDNFSLEHSREYEKNAVIKGTKGNGWGNFLEELPKKLPPMNSIVINDRYLLLNTNEKNTTIAGFWGLNNLKILLGELLPLDLKIPFHLLIFCQHPRLDIQTTDKIVNKFISDIKNLRNYPIEIEFVYDVSMHKRNLFSNYFLFYVDRAFNAFYDYDKTKLNGENDFSIKAYLNNPFASGDTEYDSARSKIKKVHEQCKEVIMGPDLSPKDKKGQIHEELVKRVVTTSTNFYHNRLFS